MSATKHRVYSFEVVSYYLTETAQQDDYRRASVVATTADEAIAAACELWNLQGENPRRVTKINAAVEIGPKEADLWHKYHEVVPQKLQVDAVVPEEHDH